MDEYVTPIQQESEDTINRDIEDSTSSSSSKEINTDNDYTMDYLLDKFFNITKPYEDQYSGWVNFEKFLLSTYSKIFISNFQLLIQGNSLSIRTSC